MSALVLVAGAILSFVAIEAAVVAQDAPPSSTSPSTQPVVDADLPSMQGRIHLATERGRRTVVLFYEDRAHVYDNDAFKGELRRFVADNHLEDRAVLYGVANLADVGMVPETLVRSMIQPAVERWGSDIMLDWEGVMRRAPFGFATDSANVGIIDRQGRLVFRHAGPMTDASRREAYRAFRASVR
jgi:hypothetical protein